MSDNEIDEDLEERLYAQIHHQEDEDSARVPQEVASSDHPQLQLSIAVDPVKRRFLSNRYWSDSGPPPPTKNNTFRPPNNRSAPGKLTTSTVLGLDKKMTEKGPVTNNPVEITGFKAYTSVLQSMGTSNTSNAGNKNFRKPHNVSKKDSRLENCPDHELSKLERVQKYLAKAQKAEMAKKKSKKQQQQQEKQAQKKQAKPITTIALDSSSSDGEDDDVIEIPVPPPPLVCLDDSSDDSMQAPTSNQPLSKGQNNSFAVSGIVRTSRCSSPSSSIISDDFIAPLDRNCLSDSMDSVNMTEEDLRAAGKTRSSVAQTLNKGKQSKATRSSETSAPGASSSVANQSSSSSVTARTRIPLLYKNLIASQKDVTIAHYHEDEATCADDVVLVAEEESSPAIVEVEAPTPVEPPRVEGKKSRRRNPSTGDSVYAKGASSGTAKRQKTTSKSVPSSDSDSDDDSATPAATVAVSVPAEKTTHSSTTAITGTATSTVSKTKATATKRKSRVQDERISESTQEEPEAGLSYIRSGEAVSSAQNPLTKDGLEKKKRNRKNTAPAEDNEFISMISTIAQGGEVSDSDSVEMLPSTIEEITIESDSPSEVAPPKNSKSSSLTFNEFPHDSVLKLVPIERREQWAICTEDRLGPQPVPRIKCLNCHEMGHMRAKCKKPVKPPTCYMCGEIGHREPRCPKASCLLCGNPTYSFQIRCRRCVQWMKVRCLCCRVLGHPTAMCPDKWRRYHSTTTNTAELTRVRGRITRRPRCCSVCGMLGHSAMECNKKRMFLEYEVHSMAIMRYDPIFQRSPECPPGIVDWNDFEGNAQSEESGNRRTRRERRREKERESVRSEGEGTSSLEQEKTTEEEAKMEVNEEKKPEISVAEKMIPPEEVQSSKKEEFRVTVNVQSEERLVSSTTKSTEAVAEKETRPRKMSPNSDSNYSFSEFFDKDKVPGTTAETTSSETPPPPPPTDPLAVSEDFISLGESSPNDNSQVTSSLEVIPAFARPTETNVAVPEQESEARIYLSKDHSKLLINEMGSKFLQELSKTCNIKVRLEWQSIGNLLTITGLHSDQNSFHTQLIKFLEVKVGGPPGATGEPTMNFPRRRDAMITFLQTNLASLDNYLGNAFDLHRKVMELERNTGSKKSQKALEKARRSLNMILFGQAGLREGGRRVDELRRNLVVLQHYQSPFVDSKFREQIKGNVKYIFSPVAHNDYKDLVDRYALWRKANLMRSRNKSTDTPEGERGEGLEEVVQGQ